MAESLVTFDLQAEGLLPAPAEAELEQQQQQQQRGDVAAPIAAGTGVGGSTARIGGSISVDDAAANGGTLRRRKLKQVAGAGFNVFQATIGFAAEVPMPYELVFASEEGTTTAPPVFATATAAAPIARAAHPAVAAVTAAVAASTALFFDDSSGVPIMQHQGQQQREWAVGEYSDSKFDDAGNVLAPPPVPALPPSAHLQLQLEETQRAHSGEHQLQLGVRPAWHRGANVTFCVLCDGVIVCSRELRVTVQRDDDDGASIKVRLAPPINLVLPVGGVSKLSLSVFSRPGEVLPPGLVPVWGHARVRVAHWVRDKALFAARYPAPSQQQHLSSGDGSNTSSRSSSSSGSNTFPPTALTLASQVMHALRLFTRASALPERARRRSNPDWGDAPVLSLAVPFCVQLDGATLSLLARVMTTVLRQRQLAAAAQSSALRSSAAAEAPSSCPPVIQLQAAAAAAVGPEVSLEHCHGMLAAALCILRSHLRRLVLTDIDPAELGIMPAVVAAGASVAAIADANAPPRFSLLELRSVLTVIAEGAAPATAAAAVVDLTSSTSDTAAAVAPLLFPVQLRAEAYSLLDAYRRLLGPAPSRACPAAATAATTAAATVEGGRPALYVEVSESGYGGDAAALLEEVVVQCTRRRNQQLQLKSRPPPLHGGVVEVQFAWPTPLAPALKENAPANSNFNIGGGSYASGANFAPSPETVRLLQFAAAVTNTNTGNSSSGGDGGERGQYAFIDFNLDNGSSGSEGNAHAYFSSGSGGGVGNAPTVGFPSTSGAASAAGAADVRFERAVLLLQSFAHSKGWRHVLRAQWGQYMHFIVELPPPNEGDGLNSSVAAVDVVTDTADAAAADATSTASSTANAFAGTLHEQTPHSRSDMLQAISEFSQTHPELGSKFATLLRGTPDDKLDVFCSYWKEMREILTSSLVSSNSSLSSSSFQSHVSSSSSTSAHAAAGLQPSAPSAAAAFLPHYSQSPPPPCAGVNPSPPSLLSSSPSFRLLLRFLSVDIARVLDAAGLCGWTFPSGCADPEIPLSLERFLGRDRAEMAATEPGAGWVR